MRETFRIARYVSARKALNFLLIWISYVYSRLIRKPVVKGNPVAISIEPTTSCNLRCQECPSGLRSFSRATGMLDYPQFIQMIDQLKKHLLYLNLYFQGEPYLNKELFRMLKYANENRIFTVTSTNAHFLDDKNAKETVLSGLDQIIVSIDGIDQETYEKYRKGGQLQKVIEGTRNLIEWKNKLKRKNPYIIFQFLLFRFNEHQIDEIKKMAGELGVDELRFKTAQIYDFNKKKEIIPEKRSFTRYRKTPDGKYRIANNLSNQCWRMWSSCVITWDGQVVPCCFDKDAKYRMGDISEGSFSDIWQSEPYYDFRKKILNSRADIDICSNCTEGTKIWA